MIGDPEKMNQVEGLVRIGETMAIAERMKIDAIQQPIREMMKTTLVEDWRTHDDLQIWIRGVARRKRSALS